MNEILALKQELLEGNFDEAMRLTTKLETMGRQDKINAIENFLTLMVSKLIAIQVATDYLFLSHLNDIRNCLIEIQHNCHYHEQFKYTQVLKNNTGSNPL